LQEIIDHLETTYCQSVGAEYMLIRNPEIISWMHNKMEPVKNIPTFTDEERKHIYGHLKQAVGFENFIHRKVVRQKRFSLEGAESLIPALDAVIEKGNDVGIDVFIM